MKGHLLQIAFLCALLCGCSTTKYVPVETVRTEYVKADSTAIYERLRSILEATYQNTASSDSVVDVQKETVVLNEQGDTVKHLKSHGIYVSSKREKELEHKVSQQDSTIESLKAQLSAAKSDTIRVPYPVGRKLSWWEQTKIDLGEILLVLLTAVIVISFIVIRRYGNN